MIKIIVTGGRDFNDKDFVFSTLHRIRRLLTDEEELMIIHGGAKGVDSLAEEWVSINFLQSMIYHADWKSYGKSAGPVRNTQMLDDHEDIDMVLAFPGGYGTNHMKTSAKKRGHLVLEVYPQ